MKRRISAALLAALLTGVGQSRLTAQVWLEAADAGQGVTIELSRGRCAIVTAAHVANQFGPTRVVGAGGVETAAEVKNSDPVWDISVLELEGSALECDAWRTPDSLDDLLVREGTARARFRTRQGAIEQMPLLITEIDDRWVRVVPQLQEHTLAASRSGGGVYAGDGELIGILLTARGRTGNVLRIDRITDVISPWLGAMEVGFQRRCGPELSFSEDDWLRLEVVDVDYLPPLSDAGQPDFYLIFSIRGDRQLGRVPVKVGTRTRTAPFRAAELLADQSLLLSLIESDSFSSEDIIEPFEIGSRRLLACQPLTLEIRPTIFRDYPSINSDRNLISLQLQSAAADPEGRSGDDRDPSTAPSVEPGSDHSGEVSFNSDDATDYVRFAGSGATVRGLLAAEPAFGGTTPSVFLDRSVGEGELVAISDDPLVYAVEGPANQVVVGIRAPEPGVQGRYRAWNIDERDGLGATPFILDVIGQSSTAPDPFWDQPTLRTLLDAIVELRRHYDVPPARVLARFEEVLADLEVPVWPDTVETSRLGFTQLPPGATRRRDAIDQAFELLQSEVGVYAPYGDPVRFPIMDQCLAIVEVETNREITDRTRLEAALRARNAHIVTRAVRAVGRLGDGEYARRVLEDLTNDQRSEVAESARSVLRRFPS